MQSKAQIAGVIALAILAFCLLFQKQVGAFLNTVSSESDAVKIGKSGIEVQFSRNRLEKITSPSQQFKSVFFQLSKRDRQALLGVGWFTPVAGLCTLEGFDRAVSSPANEADREWLEDRTNLFDNYRDHIESYLELAKLGLVTIEDGDVDEPRVCPEGNGKTAKITRAGLNVRSDYLKILDAALFVDKGSAKTDQ